MRRWSLVIVLIATSLVAVAGPGQRASACSCASVDPIDALGFGGIVFAGTVIDERSGDNGMEIWTFDVVAVIQGEVGPQITVIGDTFCGSDLTTFTEPIVVYADRREDAMTVQGCLPNPTLDTFRKLADEARRHAAELPGTGPPAALVVGRDKLANLTVVDDAGAVLARAALDHEPVAAAHCAGTSLIVTWSYGPALASGVASRENVVSIVDLTSMDVVDTRDISSEWVGVTGDDMMCLDGGDRVVVTRGFGPNDDMVTVATANADATGVSKDFTGVSRAVAHPTGTVTLLPSVAGQPIRSISPEDLEEIEGASVALPVAEATVGASLSPDGTELAVLVTTTGRDVEYNTGASAVRVFDVSTDGIVQVMSRLVELPNGTTGRAKWIEWFDDTTWVVERETDSSKVADVVTVDGALLASSDDGWGWGLTSIDAGILRTRNGALSVLTSDGSSIGVTVPNPDRIDRELFLSPFVEPPPIEFPRFDFGDVATISPPDDTIDDVAPVITVTSESRGLPVIVLIGTLLLAGLGLAAIAKEFGNWRSRRR